ncbi:DinB family protein [Deinococcus caeni]|uniref:DinB family protein n=1 Tax=Deinococcus caeni TaxID=569127 RepID=UPI003616A9CC
MEPRAGRRARHPDQRFHRARRGAAAVGPGAASHPRAPGETTPDGRRVAPPHTRPSDTGLAWEDLDTRWAQSRAGLERTAADLRATPGRTLWHPFFGELDAMDWMRMVAIHLNNHRKQLEASAAA